MTQIEDTIEQLATSMEPAVLAEFRAPERWCLARSMEACQMDALPEPTGDPAGERCSGEMVCDRCGQEYFKHPMDWRVIGYGNVPFLNVICDGRRVKL